MCWVTFEGPSSKKKKQDEKESKPTRSSQTEELVRRVKLVEMPVQTRTLRRSHGGVYRIAIPDTAPLLHGHHHHHHHHDHHDHDHDHRSASSRSEYSSTRTSTTILRGYGIKRAPSPLRHHHHGHHSHLHFSPMPGHHHHRHGSANIVIVEPPDHLRTFPFPPKRYHTLSGDRVRVRDATSKALEEVRYEAARPGRAKSCKVGGKDWISTGVPWHWDCVEDESGKKKWEKVELKYPPFGGLDKW